MKVKIVSRMKGGLTQYTGETGSVQYVGVFNDIVKKEAKKKLKEIRKRYPDAEMTILKKSD